MNLFKLQSTIPLSSSAMSSMSIVNVAAKYIPGITRGRPCVKQINNTMVN